MGSHARPNWSPEEIAHLKQLCDSGLYRFDKMAEKLGRSKSGTMYKCYEQGFNNLYRYSVYTHDETFFSGTSPLECYWAGIMATDGCLSIHRGSKTIILHVATKDRAHLERFKDAMKATNPIYERQIKCSISTRDPDKLHPYCGISISSADTCYDNLGKVFNITRNKTLRAEPPSLPSLYHRLCFIRGVIDGDGSITCGHQEGFLNISICGCNKELLAWIKQTVDDMDLPHLTNGDRTSLIYQPNGENCYYYCIRGLKACVFCEILRRLPLPRLERKWDGPKALSNIDFWKARQDVWPNDAFFDHFTKEPDTTPSLT
jgi:hypothetical protein